MRQDCSFANDAGSICSASPVGFWKDPHVIASRPVQSINPPTGRHRYRIPLVGWFPLVLGAVATLVMTTWKEGRHLVYENLQRHLVPLHDFLQPLFIGAPIRVEGTAVFFRAEGDDVPHAMLHNLLHNKILHERTVFLTVKNEDLPRVPSSQRVQVENLGHNCYQVNIHYGFMDERDIPQALSQCKEVGLDLDPMQTSYFIARQNVIPRVGSGMALWREALFATMSRNARDAADYYRVQANRVIELGTQVEI
ncbi:KUP/HAK/KT family potassium transporter [Noviherbaspirillum autotrophicum]|uniref:KUP/HAK/KT family potassium transporter n=1 Tax=Noviherbaspirillum autotrophicum TaxID=709839 RepID=UPI000A040834|nr:KUP/HAK/KT family potassium transporter [Noviherbaspirillum autotrophicum]